MTSLSYNSSFKGKKKDFGIFGHLFFVSWRESGVKSLSSVYAFHVDTLKWWKQLTEVCSNPASFLTSAHLANHSVNWMWLLAWESRRNCQMLFSHPLNPASSQQMLNLASVASLSFSHKSIREVQRWCWLISTWLKVRPTSAPEMF